MTIYIHAVHGMYIHTPQSIPQVATANKKWNIDTHPTKQQPQLIHGWLFPVKYGIYIYTPQRHGINIHNPQNIPQSCSCK